MAAQTIEQLVEKFRTLLSAVNAATSFYIGDKIAHGLFDGDGSVTHLAVESFLNMWNTKADECKFSLQAKVSYLIGLQSELLILALEMNGVDHKDQIMEAASAIANFVKFLAGPEDPFKATE